jgi:hypothetical protein
MFVKRNRTEHAGKPYQSILLVQGKRLPAKRPPGRPSTGGPPPKSVVVHETLANLSRLPAELIDLIDAFCKGQGAEALANLLWRSELFRGTADVPVVEYFRQEAPGRRRYSELICRGEFGSKRGHPGTRGWL